MHIDVSPATFFEKPILERLMQLYDHDFSEFERSDVNDNGLYIDEYLDLYWQEAGRYPFLVRVDGKLAGFVLVRKLPGEASHGEDVHSIAEFFVMRKYRGAGVGRAVAWQVFDRFPGEWRVEEMAVNLPAQAFWRKVIGEYSAGSYVERMRDDEEWQGPEQIFHSAEAMTHLHQPANWNMTNLSFRLMTFSFNIIDLLFPYIDRRVQTFGLTRGTVVVDYGCGPGRYTLRYSELVGPEGKVYAVDIQPLAVQAVNLKIEKMNLTNVEAVLAQGYDCGLPDGLADAVTAIDLFFAIPEPTLFLGELRRITKPGGTLIIDGGHEPLATTKRKILASGFWTITEAEQRSL